jgi:hypothetical protein
LVEEVEMPQRIVHHCVALFVVIFTAAAAMHGQAVVEHGMMTANSAGMAANARTPASNLGLPPSAPSAAPGAAASLASFPEGNTEAATKANLLFFQDHSGPDAAQIALHTVPDHAQAWIDGKFVGPTPLDLKIAPGHHQVIVHAPNMQDSVREFDLTAKQTQSIDLPMKSAYQSQVSIHWPSQK